MGFCVVSAAETGVPWHLGPGTKGKAGALRYFESLASTVDHKLFEQRDFAAMNRHVYATVRLVQSVRATGKTIEQPEVVHHFHVQERQGRPVSRARGHGGHQGRARQVARDSLRRLP